MSYTECPYCRKAAKFHGSFFSKEIGSPIIECEQCGKILADNHMYEWGAIPIESKLNYCIFSNYRIAIHWLVFIIPASIMANISFFTGILVLIISEAILCPLLYYCVVSLNSVEIEKSVERAKNPEYIDKLAVLKYEHLDLQRYNEYLDRKNSKLNQRVSEDNSFQITDDIIKNHSIEKPKIENYSITQSPVSSFSALFPTPIKPPKAVSNTEKIQMSLDRWKNRYKSDWDIGIEYERYVGYRLECEGYKVNYSGATNGLNDMGRDLIATKRDKTLVIQCKRWSKEKVIHEKHIFQLHGSTAVLSAENPGKSYKAVFITTTKLSDTAKKCAEICNVTCVENFPMADYPLIKCNSNKDGEKIYHLPFDPQYDKIVISKNKKSCYAWTVQEAEKLGFRHTYHYHSNKF